MCSINNSVPLLIDFHCHLSLNEVCGYLGGDWDSGTNTMIVKYAYPHLIVPQDTKNATLCEINIQKQMIKDNVKLVGWYHSHPTFEAHPTLRDIDNQLDYQVQLRGTSEATYSPCLAIISSPYDKKSPALDSNMMPFWVVPPSEQKALEYGRPMMMHYTPLPEKSLPAEFQAQAEEIVNYYKSFRALLDLNLTFKDKISYFDALKTSMLARIPQSENKEDFWSWIRELLNIKKVVPESPESKVVTEVKKDENPLMRELIEQKPALPKELATVEAATEPTPQAMEMKEEEEKPEDKSKVTDLTINESEVQKKPEPEEKHNNEEPMETAEVETIE